MLPIELIRIVLTTSDEPRKSALRLWTGHVSESDPSFLETDDDGDTFARGAAGGHWLEISRIDDDVILSVLASEENRELQRFQTFDDGPEACAFALKVAAGIARETLAQQIQISIQFSEKKETATQALESFSRLLPEIPVPANSTEIEYRTVVLGCFEFNKNFDFSHQAEWRTGRRVSREAGEESSLIVHAFGSSQGVRYEADGDSLVENIDAVLLEMMAIANNAGHGGLNGI